MRLGLNMKVYDYWDSLREDDGPPLRRNFDPMAISPCLPHIFVLGADKGRQPVFRLAGTAIGERFPAALKDALFSAIWRHEDAWKADHLAYTAMTDGLPGLVSACMADSAEDDIIEMLLLPLKTADGGPHRLLGTLAITGRTQIPSMPRPDQLIYLGQRTVERGERNRSMTASPQRCSIHETSR